MEQLTAPGDDKSTQAENELICRELLKLDSYGMPLTFTTWADCGLILEALNRIETISPALAECFRQMSGALRIGRLTPTAIRSIALSYLRSLER